MDGGAIIYVLQGGIVSLQMINHYWISSCPKQLEKMVILFPSYIIHQQPKTVPKKEMHQPYKTWKLKKFDAY